MTTQAAPAVTAEDRERLAELINGRPVPITPNTIGPMFERDLAYERADKAIAEGWVRIPAEGQGRNNLLDKIAHVLANGGRPSAASFNKASAILKVIEGRP